MLHIELLSHVRSNEAITTFSPLILLQDALIHCGLSRPTNGNIEMKAYACWMSHSFIVTFYLLWTYLLWERWRDILQIHPISGQVLFFVAHRTQFSGIPSQCAGRTMIFGNVYFLLNIDDYTQMMLTLFWSCHVACSGLKHFSFCITSSLAPHNKFVGNFGSKNLFNPTN